MTAPTLTTTPAVMMAREWTRAVVTTRELTPGARAMINNRPTRHKHLRLNHKHSVSPRVVETSNKKLAIRN